MLPALITRRRFLQGLAALPLLSRLVRPAAAAPPVPPKGRGTVRFGDGPALVLPEPVEVWGKSLVERTRLAAACGDREPESPWYYLRFPWILVPDRPVPLEYCGLAAGPTRIDLVTRDWRTGPDVPCEFLSLSSLGRLRAGDPGFVRGLLVRVRSVLQTAPLPATLEIEDGEGRTATLAWDGHGWSGSDPRLRLFGGPEGRGWSDG